MDATLIRYANICYNAGSNSRLEFFNMPPSFICLVKTTMLSCQKQAVLKLNKLNYKSCSSLNLFEHTNIAELNHLLFRCLEEENDISNKQRGPYGLKSGMFKYAGL